MYPSSQRYISTVMTTSSTLPLSCWTGTSSGSFARNFKTNGHQPQAPLVPPAQAGWHEVESPNLPPQTFQCLRGKNSLQIEGDCTSLLPVLPNMTVLIRDLHRHHHVDPSYRPFDERGVAAAIRKADSSTNQGSDGLTVLHLCHLGEHGLTFLKEVFNLSVA